MRRTLLITLVTTLLAIVPRAALACPVCFGQSDSPLALGINYGILAMLGFIGSVLLGFATFFVYLMRRARLADALTAAESGASTSVKAELLRQVPHAQEGTI
jgi:multidrug transporter EmrE-like cation transporter